MNQSIGYLDLKEKRGPDLHLWKYPEPYWVRYRADCQGALRAATQVADAFSIIHSLLFFDRSSLQNILFLFIYIFFFFTKWVLAYEIEEVGSIIFYSLQ